MIRSESLLQKRCVSLSRFGKERGGTRKIIAFRRLIKDVSLIVRVVVRFVFEER